MQLTAQNLLEYIVDPELKRRVSSTNAQILGELVELLNDRKDMKEAGDGRRVVEILAGVCVWMKKKLPETSGRRRSQMAVPPAPAPEGPATPKLTAAASAAEVPATPKLTAAASAPEVLATPKLTAAASAPEVPAAAFAPEVPAAASAPEVPTAAVAPIDPFDVPADAAASAAVPKQHKRKHASKPASRATQPTHPGQSKNPKRSRKAKPPQPEPNIGRFVRTFESPTLAVAPPGADAARLAESVRLRIRGLEAAPSLPVFPLSLPGGPPVDRAFRKGTEQRTEQRSAPPRWCEATAQSELEAHLVVPHAQPDDGACNQTIAWIDRPRASGDIRRHMGRCVLVPSLVRRICDVESGGFHLQCALYAPSVSRQYPMDDSVCAAMLLTAGRWVAFVAPDVSVCGATVHYDQKTMDDYVTSGLSVPNVPNVPNAQAPCDSAEATCHKGLVANEVVLWALYDDRWRSSMEAGAVDPGQAFWHRPDGTQRAIADFWEHLAPAPKEAASLGVDWGGEGGAAADDRGEASILFAHPPARWFDGVRGLEGESGDARVRLVMVRCLASTTEAALGAERCLPYAVVEVGAGPWLRTVEGVEPFERRNVLWRMRRLCGLAEALHDTVLHGTYAAAARRLQRHSFRPPPQPLVCDDRVCAYASCLQTLMSSQRNGVDLRLKSCHRAPHCRSAGDARHLSFVGLVVQPDDARSVEEWYERLLLPTCAEWEHDSSPTVDLAEMAPDGSLQRTLLKHPTGHSAWTGRGRTVYHSAWAVDVAVELVRSGAQRALFGSGDEVALLLVSGCKEARRCTKKAIDALDADFTLEAVVRVAVLTPLAQLPPSPFE